MIVGLAATLTGQMNHYREVFLEGAEMLCRGGVRYLLVDDQADPAVATDCARALVAAKADLIVGHFSSACARAAADAYARASIPVVLPASTANDLRERDGVHVLCPGDLEQGACLSEWVRSRVNAGFAHCTVFVENSAYASMLLNFVLGSLDGYAHVVSVTENAGTTVPPNGVSLILGHTPFAKRVTESLARQAQCHPVLMCDEAGHDSMWSHLRGFEKQDWWIASPRRSYKAIFMDALATVTGRLSELSNGEEKSSSALLTEVIRRCRVAEWVLINAEDQCHDPFTPNEIKTTRRTTN